MAKSDSSIRVKPGFSAAEARDVVKMNREAQIGQSRDTRVLAEKYRRDPQYHEACRWVWERRLEGLSPEKIAALSLEHFGEKITWPRVEAMIVAGYSALPNEPLAQEMRKLDNARLEWYLECLTPRIKVGDDKAINTAVRILERRSNMFGYDAPKRIHAHIEGAIDPEVLDLVASARDQMRTELARQLPAGETPDQDIEDAEVIPDSDTDEEGYVDLDLGNGVEPEEL